MPDLSFQVESSETHPYAASPIVIFKLRVNNHTEEEIHSVVLRSQIMIDTTKRQYNPREQSQMRDLFGEPERWSVTLKTMLWTHANAVAPPFTSSILIDLPVTCTFDFNVAAAKFFGGIEEGEVPLSFLFSGTIFYMGKEGALQVTQIPWEKEAKFRFPIKVWKEMMDLYYPNTAWLCLRKDIFQRLYDYKVRHSIPTWEALFDLILPPEKENLPS